MSYDPAAVIDILTEANVGYRQNSRSWICACPRCGKQNKLYLRKVDGRFVCFVCRETSKFYGKPEYALHELTTLPVSDIRKRIYGESAEHVPAAELAEIPLLSYFGDDDITEDVSPTLPTVYFPPDFYPTDHRFSEKGLKYLESRGISLALAQKYGLRYCPPTRRVVFPVENGGRLLGWQARAIFKTENWNEDLCKVVSAPKILSSEFRKDLTLMFGDNLKGSNHAIITEGPMDALKCSLAGGAVATMGKAISMSQLKMIQNSGVKKVYLALDPDAASEMDRVCRILGDLELYNLQPGPGYKDLGEMSVEAVYERFVEAPRIEPGHLFVHLSY